MMNFAAKLEKAKTFWFALFFGGLFFLLRFPSLFEPNWYGDEGIYQVIGRMLRAGKILYTQAWDNKPPTLYYIYAFFDANQFAIRFFSLFIGVVSIVVFFFLCQKLFRSLALSSIISTVFLLLFATPIIEGNIANAENFMLLPFIVALFFVYTKREALINSKSSSTNLNPTSWQNLDKKLFLIGLLIGISFTIKVLAFFDLMMLSVFVFMYAYPKRQKLSLATFLRHFKNIFILLIPMYYGFLLPFIGYVIYFILHGALAEFLSSAFLGNIGYVGYANNFIIPQGGLIMRTIILLAALYFIFKARLKDSTLLIMLILAFSSYSVFFSYRPYPHYLLLLVPGISLVLGFVFQQRALSTSLVTIAGIVGLLFFFHVDMQKSPLSYYHNFIAYLSGSLSTTAYQASFDPDVPRDYALAEYLKQKISPGKKVFLWGNTPQVYVLANLYPPGRYSVAYHVAYDKKAIAETNHVLEQEKPELVVILPDENKVSFSLANYRYLVSLMDATIYERIY